MTDVVCYGFGERDRKGFYLEACFLLTNNRGRKAILCDT